jgi:hypothetical protein
MGHPYAVRLGLPGPAGSASGTIAHVSEGPAAPEAASGTETTAGAAVAEDPAAGELSAPIFRMRFGRDLRLAEVCSALLTHPDPLASCPVRLAGSWWPDV